jgi:hypothetical protein
MRTGRRIAIRGASVAALVVATSTAIAGQQPAMPAHQHDMATSMTTPSPATKAERIANAAAAAPRSISDHAAIFDWPATEGGAPVVLRAGTNGWSCFPDMPQTTGNDPMCLDGPWMKWIEAYLGRTAPMLGTIGVGYMLAPGGGFGSNTDPYATVKTADNHWGLHHPHLMIAVPDVRALAGISTDPESGGPYVMWEGTPYAHIMAPVTSAPAMK